MVDNRPTSIYDYWQALTLIEEEVKTQKEQVVLPAGAEHWQTLIFIEEWLKSQKERVIIHGSRYSKFAERLLKTLDKEMD